MNPEQAKSAVRWLIATFGPFITAHGYASSSTIEMIGGILVSAIPLIFSMMAHTEANAVAVVGAIAADPNSSVKGVITTATVAGRELAQSIPGPTVVQEGTTDARAIATQGTAP